MSREPKKRSTSITVATTESTTTTKEPFQPLKDFIGPGRRRSDHPLVVGTIVLCCGIIAIGTAVQVGATLWAGSQVKILLEKDQKRDASTDNMRRTIIKYSEAQATVMRTVCLNVAKSERDRADCMVPVPEVTSKGPEH